MDLIRAVYSHDRRLARNIQVGLPAYPLSYVTSSNASGCNAGIHARPSQASLRKVRGEFRDSSNYRKFQPGQELGERPLGGCESQSPKACFWLSSRNVYLHSREFSNKP